MFGGPDLSVNSKGLSADESFQISLCAALVTPGDAELFPAAFVTKVFVQYDFQSYASHGAYDPWRKIW